MNKEQFKASLDSSIDAKFASIMSTKTPKDRYLNYIDALTLTTMVRNVFNNRLGTTPPQVEAACRLSEAVLAPTAREREDHIKAAVAVGGGAAGIGMILAGIGAILGWGAGVWAAIVTFFTGVQLLGPIAWIAGGLAVAGVAGYFALTGNPQKDTERFLAVLKSSCGQAVDAIWEECNTKLSAE